MENLLQNNNSVSLIDDTILIPESEIWNEINKIRWFFSMDEEKLGKEISNKYSDHDLVEIKNFAIKKRKLLENRWLSFLRILPKEVRKKYDVIPHNNLFRVASNIVGFGEVLFNMFMNDIALLKEVAIKDDVCFDYVFDYAIAEKHLK